MSPPLQVGHQIMRKAPYHKALQAVNRTKKTVHFFHEARHPSCVGCDASAEPECVTAFLTGTIAYLRSNAMHHTNHCQTHTQGLPWREPYRLQGQALTRFRLRPARLHGLE